MINENIK